ncbi:MAG: PilZ domain-containing protein [Sphingomonadales bacterium]|mgnify:CR=1 FL=1|nr:PilZ domain-containing protein [Sphingomonadales bacterium]
MDTLNHYGRLAVDIPVTVTSVLDSQEAAIADLSQDGALIKGCSLEPGARFQIDYFGQILFAQCRWSEVDRMGCSFLFPLVDGPLYERLTVARMMRFPAGLNESDAAYVSAQRAARLFGRRLN